MNIINDIYKYVNMYELPTVYGNDFTQSLILPTNMYEMPKVYETALQTNEVNGNINDILIDKNLFKGIDKHLALNPLKDLLSRQQLLLQRLEALEKGLDSLDRPAKSEEKKLNKVINSSKNKSLKQSLTSSSIGCSEEAFNSLKDIVIASDGKQIPLSVLALIKQLKSLGLKISIRHHFHSSLRLKNETVSNLLNKSLSTFDLNQKSDENRVESRVNYDLILTFIFKDISGIEMILSPTHLTPIESEANILRFMARFAAKVRPELSYLYEGMDDISRLTAVDHFVDEINAKIFVNFQEKYVSELDSRLSSNRYLCPNSLTIADLLFWSGLNQRISPKLSSNLKKWLDSVKQFVLNETKRL